MRRVLLLLVPALVACGTTVSSSGSSDAAPEADVADIPDASDAPPMDAAPPADVVEEAPPNPCEARGGICVVAMRLTTFTVTCPPGRVTPFGQRTWSGPGNDLASGGTITGGCRPVSGGFEGTYFGCCLPADAGP